jgi:hypothetical protein
MQHICRCVSCSGHRMSQLFMIKFFDAGYVISCFFFFPTIFMAVVYYKISRELIKQNRYMKNVCSNPGRRSAPGSFNILKFICNRRTFLVCLTTVLCYGIGNIPMTVHHILKIAGEDHFLMKYVWILYLANVLRVASSHSVNPLIYGRLDKKLFPFWKLCRKKKQRPQANWLDSSCSKLNKRDIFIDCQPHRYGRLFFQDETCISFNSLFTTVKNRK